MNTTLKIMKYEFFDVVRSKWLIFYTLFFAVVTDMLFRFGGGGEKVILSFMNIMLFLIPLVCVVFGTMYLYNSREFIELLLAQPIDRKHLFRGMYWGLSLPLSVGFLAGVGLPFAAHDSGGNEATLLLLLVAGVFLACIFTAIAFFFSLQFEDRARGFGAAILCWLLLAVVYDGLILAFSFVFSDYPLEKPMIGISLLNPIDLARMLVLLKSDYSALMGYTGAVFKAFFGSAWGIIISLLFLFLWSAGPFLVSSRTFCRKDF